MLVLLLQTDCAFAWKISIVWGRRGRDRMVVGFTTCENSAYHNKNDHNDITEILLKVALSTINHHQTSIYELNCRLYLRLSS